MSQRKHLLIWYSLLFSFFVLVFQNCQGFKAAGIGELSANSNFPSNESRLCTIANGTGNEVWNGSSYEPCTIL